MAGANVIPDGNDEIIAEMPLIVEVIARTARWVHRRLPATSRLEPLGRARPLRL